MLILRLSILRMHKISITQTILFITVLVTYKFKIEDRCRKVATLLAQSMIETDIAHELKVDQSTISRDLKVKNYHSDSYLIQQNLTWLIITNNILMEQKELERDRRSSKVGILRAMCPMCHMCQALEPSLKKGAMLLLYSNVEWSGSILDMRLHYATYDGKGDSKLQFVCNHNNNNGAFSISLQKLSLVVIWCPL